MPRVRRDLESVKARERHAGPVAIAVRDALVRDLEELIEALDRRVPAVQRSGEAAIARAAATLRAEAVRRIDQLTRERQETR